MNRNKFEPIKVKYVRQKPETQKRQEELITNILQYYYKALVENDRFMELSAIENLIYLYRRNEIDSQWFEIGEKSMTDIELLYLSENN